MPSPLAGEGKGEGYMSISASNVRPPPDKLLTDIADYVADYVIESQEAYDTARYCLIDTLGCALLALRYPDCVRILGPVVPGATLQNGARVPGTRWELDPVRAAFNIGSMIRWLDFNDTWLAAEHGSGHRGARDPNQDDMVQAHAVKAIFQR